MRNPTYIEDDPFDGKKQIIEVDEDLGFERVVRRPTEPSPGIFGPGEVEAWAAEWIAKNGTIADLFGRKA